MTTTTVQEIVGADTLAAWRQRLIDLDLDPDLDAINRGIIKHTRSLEELKRWYDIPPNDDAPINDVKPEKVATMPMGLVRRYITEHIYQQRVIINPATIRALEKRAGRLFLYVQAASDITITAAAPLIINNAGVLTIYNNVTIQDGGFIQITAPCTFTCNNLTKVQSGTGGAFDVSVLGLNGTAATAGTSPAQPSQGAGGAGNSCDCCGGTESSAAVPGAAGTVGPNGGSAQANATPGEHGPIVYFSIADQLTGTLSFLNQGGNGGNGGAGGNGAQGGQGGNGGNGGYCGAIHCDGATGGAGGQGGTGGNGSNGANGGKGGTLTIIAPKAGPGSVLVTNGNAPGGTAGAAGALGQGGPGGAGGSEGGSNGGNGAPGAANGEPGAAGNVGAEGSATLNGT